MATDASAQTALRTRKSPTAYLMPTAATLLLLLLVLWLGINFVKGPAYFVTIFFIGLTNGALYALVALGYTLVYGILELINFAHGDVFMLGGMFSATMILSAFHLTTQSSPGLLVAAIVASLGVAMVACGVINATVEFVAYRPLRGAPRLAPLITAIGMSFILQDVAIGWKGTGYTAVPQVLPTGNVFSFKGVAYPWEKFIVVLITVPVLVALIWLVQKTKQGKAMRATAQDRDAAAIMGINVNRTITFTFLIAGMLAGRGRPRLRPVLQADSLRHGLRARAHRVYGCRPRRHRQPPGRGAWRALHRFHPGLQRGLAVARAGKRLDAVDCLRDPHPHPRLPSRRIARRANA